MIADEHPGALASNRTDALASLRRSILQRAIKFCQAVHYDGKICHWAIDLREVLYDPRSLKIASQLLWDMLRDLRPDCIGGMTMSAEQLTCGIMQAALAEGHHLHGFSVRRSRKRYGMRRQVEGVAPGPGARTVIVDDLIDSGQTMADVIAVLRPFGGQIVGIAAVLNFCNPRASISLEGLPVKVLLSLDDLGIRHAIKPPVQAPSWLFRPLNRGNYTAPQSTPLIDPQGIVAAGDMGCVISFTPSGEERWRVKTQDREKGVRTAIVSFEDSIIFGAYDGLAYRVARDTGRILWSRRLGDLIGASLALDPGRGLAYAAANFHSRTSVFVALALSDGSLVWQRPTIDYTYARPAIVGNGAVIFASNNGLVQAVSDKTGEILWRTTVPGPVKGWIVTDGSRCFLGCFDGNLYALDARIGRILWAKKLSDWLLVHPALHGESVIVSARSHLCSLSKENGTINWLVPMAGRVTGAAIAPSGSYCVAASDSGLLTCLDVTSGECIWHYRAAGAFRATPGLSPRAFAIPCYDGALYVFSHELGRVVN
jgi:orotate phosphoribosyltransferase